MDICKELSLNLENEVDHRNQKVIKKFEYDVIGWILVIMSINFHIDEFLVHVDLAIINIVATINIHYHKPYFAPSVFSLILKVL